MNFNALEQFIATNRTVAAASAAWRQRVEQCAVQISDDVLTQFLSGDECPDVSVEELAAALWIKQWLGDTDWDGSGRGSGGST